MTKEKHQFPVQVIVAAQQQVAEVIQILLLATLTQIAVSGVKAKEPMRVILRAMSVAVQPVTAAMECVTIMKQWNHVQATAVQRLQPVRQICTMITPQAILAATVLVLMDASLIIKAVQMDV